MLLKQICHSAWLLISRHFGEEHLLVAFSHKLKNFVQFSRILDHLHSISIDVFKDVAHVVSIGKSASAR